MNEDFTYVPMRERYMDWVMPVPESGCWLWTGSVCPEGYGRIKPPIEWGAAPIATHRFFYRKFKGEIPAGAMVLHKCDVRTCVNPDHLMIGTHHMNMTQMAERQRNNPHRKLTADAARAIAKDSRSCSVVAEEYGVNATTIFRIRHGISWRWATGLPNKSKSRSKYAVNRIGKLEFMKGSGRPMTDKG